MTEFLLCPATLDTLLYLRSSDSVGEMLDRTLLDPTADILRRPSKRFRERLVVLGYEFSGRKLVRGATESAQVARCSLAIELLHAGSLVVDDIQDQSATRRGAPALHVKYGLPVALNAANWLYFWPLILLREGGFPPGGELRMYRYWHQVLAQAHCGQALDVGVMIDKLPFEQIVEVCSSAIQLKSGALVALALVLGAVVAEADDDLITRLDRVGHQLGAGLQMADDLGNFKGWKEPEKRYEDLVNRRPSWIWAFTAEHYGSQACAELLACVRELPDDGALLDWSRRNDFFAQALSHIWVHFERVQEEFENILLARGTNAGPLDAVRWLTQEIVRAYG